MTEKKFNQFGFGHVLIGSGVLHTEQNQELSLENKNGYAKQNEQ